jgi:hypothetical protein
MQTAVHLRLLDRRMPHLSRASKLVKSSLLSFAVRDGEGFFLQPFVIVKQILLEFYTVLIGLQTDSGVQQLYVIA